MYQELHPTDFFLFRSIAISKGYTEDDIKKLLNVFAASLRIFKSETIAYKAAIATLKNKYNPSPVIEVVGIDANKNCKTEIAYALRYT